MIKTPPMIYKRTIIINSGQIMSVFIVSNSHDLHYLTIARDRMSE